MNGTWPSITVTLVLPRRILLLASATAWKPIAVALVRSSKATPAPEPTAVFPVRRVDTQRIRTDGRILEARQIELQRGPSRRGVSRVCRIGRAAQLTHEEIGASRHVQRPDAADVVSRARVDGAGHVQLRAWNRHAHADIRAVVDDLRITARDRAGELHDRIHGARDVGRARRSDWSRASRRSDRAGGASRTCRAGLTRWPGCTRWPDRTRRTGGRT